MNAEQRERYRIKAGLLAEPDGHYSFPSIEECPNLADCPQCDATVTEKFLKIIRSLLPSRRQHYED